MVDPLDGTREFVAGIPEWCVSIGLVEDGEAVAGGVANPQTGEIVVGAVTLGVTYNGTPAQISRRDAVTGATVLASRERSETGRVGAPGWRPLHRARHGVRGLQTGPRGRGPGGRHLDGGAQERVGTWPRGPRWSWPREARCTRSTASVRGSEPVPLLLRGLVAHGPHLRVEVEAEVTRAAALRAERKAAEKGGTA